MAETTLPALSAETRGTAPGRDRLAGRRLLVVGGGTQPSSDPDAPVGNGRAISVLAAREGATVVVADRDEAAARVTVDLIEAENGRAHSLVADVSDAEMCERIVDRSNQILSGIDAIVLNVGIGLGRGLAGTTIEQWDAVAAVNLRAHFAIIRAAQPLLAPGSSVVLVGSVAGLKPGTNIPAYDATKAALEGLMRHAAVECAPQIRVNLLIPGIIDTPLGRSARDGRPSRAETRVPLKRDGTAWDIAYAAIWLLSDEVRTSPASTW